MSLNQIRLPMGSALAAMAAFLAGCAGVPPLDAQAVLRQAETATGAANLKTLSFSGRGTGTTFGQAWQPGMAWPALNYSLLTRAVDYEAGAFREDFARSRGEPNGGGATPLMGTGEQRAVGLARGDFAWVVNGTAVAPSPAALDGRLHDLWTTPHGAIKAAQKYGATAVQRSEGGQTYRAVSFSVPGRLQATALIDSAGLVSKIESRMPNPVLGDIAVTTTFSDWRDAGAGVKFPMRIQQSQGGWPVLDLQVSEVKPNAPVDITLPEAVRNFSERAVSERVAEGVWFIAGGSHNSVVIEMSDHLVLVESPLEDGRASAVMAEAKRLSLGKPIKTVINSHHHFDHAGGLRAAVAEGATLVTSAMAKPYFERVFANPNQIRPDRLAQSGKTANIIGVDGKLVLRDGARTVEVHEMQGSVHSQGFMLVYLPKERLLIEADAYTPGPPNSPVPPVPNANAVNLVQNIERLGLGVDRILPLHGRVVPVGELMAFVGRKQR